MIEEAVQALKNGEMILLYDFDHREGETDLAIEAHVITPRKRVMSDGQRCNSMGTLQ
jgi:3,4-dihydroxy 2-butanone 4-phosphate synthase